MNFLSILDWVGRIMAVLAVVALIGGFYAWVTGILPAVIRLGKGLSKRKIAIFAKGDVLKSLEDLLSDSKLFKKKNVIGISSSGDFGRAEQVTLFLVFWPDWR